MLAWLVMMTDLGRATNSVWADLQTDYEHEKHEAKLAERIQRSEAVRGKQAVHGRGRNSAEQGWTEQDPGHHFTDHRGLADEPGGRGHQAGGGQDHHHLEEQ
jgi:hypothetical protein